MNRNSFGTAAMPAAGKWRPAKRPAMIVAPDKKFSIIAVEPSHSVRRLYRSEVITPVTASTKFQIWRLMLIDAWSGVLDIPIDAKSGARW